MATAKAAEAKDQQSVERATSEEHQAAQRAQGEEKRAQQKVAQAEAKEQHDAQEEHQDNAAAAAAQQAAHHAMGLEQQAMHGLYFFGPMLVVLVSVVLYFQRQKVRGSLAQPLLKQDLPSYKKQYSCPARPVADTSSQSVGKGYKKMPPVPEG